MGLIMRINCKSNISRILIQLMIMISKDSISFYFEETNSLTCKKIKPLVVLITLTINDN